ncbi:MAG: hypothetical protein AAB328_02045 [candidate division NC10 bacterium]
MVTLLRDEFELTILSGRLSLGVLVVQDSTRAGRPVPLPPGASASAWALRDHDGDRPRSGLLVACREHRQEAVERDPRLESHQKVWPVLPHDIVEHVGDLEAQVSVGLYGYAFAALQQA